MLFELHILYIKDKAMKQSYHNILFITALFIFLCPTPVRSGIFSRKTDSIKIVFDSNQLVLPGEQFKIGVVSYHKKGKVRKTIGTKGGSVFWWRYCVEVIGGESSGGKITVSPKLYPSKGKYISIKIWPRKDKKLAQTLLVPLNYETQISFKPTAPFDKAPGCFIKGEIVARFNNNQIRTYDLRSRDTERIFKLNSNGILLRRNRLQIEPDFRYIVDHSVGIWGHSLRNPDASFNYSFMLDYIHDYTLALSGTDGQWGFDGTDGFSGTNGHNGSDGGPGSNGGPGCDGPDIGVWVDNYFDSTLNCNLLYVYAENYQTGKEYYYLINPRGGNLTVRSMGGDGGRGGNGGDGGNGGRGPDGRVWYETITKTRIVKKPFTETVTKTVKKRRTTGTGEEEEYEETVTEQITVYKDVKETYQERVKHQERGGDGGDGGNGGAGGLGGSGGWGGNIYLNFTDDARVFTDRITPLSIGGDGGINGNGGNGGAGGSGGSGDPDGRNGHYGWDGPEAFGWAPDGSHGQVFYQQKNFSFMGPIPGSCQASFFQHQGL